MLGQKWLFLLWVLWLQNCYLFFILIFILFLAELGLCCCARAFSSCGEQGATLRCSARASQCGGFSCCRAWDLGMWASVVVARGPSSCGSHALECRLSSCGAWAYLLCGMGSFRTRDQTHIPCIGRRIFFLINLFIYLYFWLCWVFVSVRGLSLVAASGGHSSSRCTGLSLSRPLIAEHRLQMRRLSSCGSRA